MFLKGKLEIKLAPCVESGVHFAMQTEIYSPCVKMLTARWGSQVIPAGS